MSVIEHTELVIHEIDERTVWRHVKLTADDGSVGFGEYTTGGATNALDDFARLVLGELVGRKADAKSSTTLKASLEDSFQAWTLLSAVEQALADIRAQQAAMPLARHINGAATLRPVPLYANINRRTRSRDPESFAASAEDAVNAGFDAIKIAPFDGLTPSACSTPHGRALISAGLDRIAAVHARIAGKAELRIDCHWRLTFDEAALLVPVLAELGVAWLECPIPESPAAIPALQRLRTMCREHGMRLAGCELMNGLSGFLPYIEGEAYDVIMPDVKYAGGHSEIARIAERAARSDIACSLHNPSGPIAHTASVHLASAIGGAERLEFQFDETPLFFQIVEPAPEFSEGNAIVPLTPGLGCALVETDPL